MGVNIHSRGYRFLIFVFFKRVHRYLLTEWFSDSTVCETLKFRFLFIFNKYWYGKRRHFLEKISSNFGFIFGQYLRLVKKNMYWENELSLPKRVILIIYIRVIWDLIMYMHLIIFSKVVMTLDYYPMDPEFEPSRGKLILLYSLIFSRLFLAFLREVSGFRK